MSCGRRNRTAVKTSGQVKAQSRGSGGAPRLAEPRRPREGGDATGGAETAADDPTPQARRSLLPAECQALVHRQTSRPRRSAARPATAEKFIITKVNAIAREAARARWNSAPASARP